MVNKVGNKAAFLTRPDEALRDEVELVDAVKGCRTCKWFWGAIPPYGPFPSHDWHETYPPEIKNGPPPSDDRQVLWAQVDLTGSHLVEPAVLRGCRKAPIMTVGINPNMTGFFPSAGSGRWSYPWFRDRATYAYYYRHATIYQESFGAESIEAGVVPGSEVRAPITGRLEVKRSQCHRWMEFRFFAEDQPENADVPTAVIERDWPADDVFTVFAENTQHRKLGADRLAASRQPNYIKVEAGDLVAALTSPQATQGVDLYANKTGYYEQFMPTLARFGDFLNRSGFENANLSMGEDVSMNDLVACASPGWGDQYDIPRERIADNCAKHKHFALDQIVQSQPALIVVVSDSSLTMFDLAVRAAGGELELDFADKDIYALLRETRERACHMRLPLATGEVISSRLLVVPHFSYSDNFNEQSRFTRRAYELFCAQYPIDAEALSDAKRIRARADDNYISVDLQANEDPLQDTLSKAAWATLMAYHYQPQELMFETLVDEHERRPLISDVNAEHLERDPYSCQFCDNTHWQFPEGCEYR
ncbi:MAG: hypothetical protein AAF499_11450 [Pseudomonadota bacterium]